MRNNLLVLMALTVSFILVTTFIFLFQVKDPTKIVTSLYLDNFLDTLFKKQRSYTFEELKNKSVQTGKGVRKASGGAKTYTEVNLDQVEWVKVKSIGPDGKEIIIRVPKEN